MGIFKEMFERRNFAADWEYRDLRRMLSEAISRGFVEQVPVTRPSRFLPNQQWYRDKETGEIYRLVPPEEKNRGSWHQVDLQDLIEPGEPIQ